MKKRDRDGLKKYFAEKLRTRYTELDIAAKGTELLEDWQRQALDSCYANYTHIVKNGSGNEIGIVYNKMEFSDEYEFITSLNCRIPHGYHIKPTGIYMEQNEIVPGLILPNMVATIDDGKLGIFYKMKNMTTGVSYMSNLNEFKKRGKYAQRIYGFYRLFYEYNALEPNKIKVINIK